MQLDTSHRVDSRQTNSVGASMTYEMTLTRNNLAISEQEYCVSHVVTFTGIDSCMGIIACDGKCLTAAHLVLIDKKGNAFDPKDIGDILGVFRGGPYSQVCFVGELSNWGSVIQEFSEKLLAPDGESDYSDLRGLVGARISNAGKIIISNAKKISEPTGATVSQQMPRPSGSSRPRSSTV